MRMNLGKIGAQESTSLVAIVLSVTGIFTVESAVAYANGNSTFLTVPASIIVGFLVFLLCLFAMNKLGVATFHELADRAVGEKLSCVFMLILSASLLFNAFVLLLRFATIIHSYIFVESDYIGVALWIFLPVLSLSLFGFETLGRMAKIFGVALLVLFLLGFVSATDGFSVHRLYPLFGDGAYNIAISSFKNSYKFIPAFIAPLVLSKGINGVKTVKKSVIIGSIFAVLLSFITQLVIGLTYEYTSLSNMYFPLCRLNMSLQNEDYFMRTDRIGVFIWLVAGVIAIAYYVYAAGFIFCKKTGTRDIRPCIVCFMIILSSLVLAEYTKLYAVLHGVISIIESNSFIVMLLIVLTVTLLGLLKRGKERQKE